MMKDTKTSIEIEKGTPVVLKGLDGASHLNGRTAMVVDDKNPKGRYAVKLDGPYRSPATGNWTDAVTMIKEENLSFTKKMCGLQRLPFFFS